MNIQSIRAMQADTPDTGKLKISVRAEAQAIPIEEARVSICYSGEPNSIIEEVTTNALGQSENLTLPAPPLEYSMAPSEVIPYSEYILRITAPGYQPIEISGTEILPEVTALQEVRLRPLESNQPSDNIVIPSHTLYKEYPPKIAEAEIKSISQVSEIALNRVIVPEFIVVHDGSPRDTTAKEYYVRYSDYIKNVASSEIYATWPESTIHANVLAIMSFTLNRVYTEWYYSKGYNFTITSSSAFDHKWMHGRNIYDKISIIVDNIFANYLSRPNVKQPILTQFCDGNMVRCPKWLMQWNSKELGEQGYTPIQILQNFYGDDMYINTAEDVSGVPLSWSGHNLDIGSSGELVLIMQEHLNRIIRDYPVDPLINLDGIYGESTANAVRVLQGIFDLPQTGVVDYATWYKISDVYVVLSRIVELG